MSSEDYLTRYFQQLGMVLAALMGFREKKKYQLAIEEINQVLDTWFHLHAGDIEQASPAELEAVLNSGKTPDLDKIKAVAELLYQKVITFKEMRLQDEVLHNAQKSLHLFKVYDRQSGAFSIDIQQRIAELDQVVSGADSV